MMPSRGMHVARGKVPRILRPQCRNLSSTPRPHPRISSHGGNSIVGPSRPWTRSIPATIPTVAAVRHLSWWPSSSPSPPGQPAVPEPPVAAAAPPPPPPPPPAAAAAQPPTPPATETASFPNLDTITLDDIDLKGTAADLSNIPEGIGYLQQVGIDYGWGPTSMIQWALEHIHIYGGLPWWASIAATAVLIRVVTFPFYLKSSDMMARQSALVSVTKPISDRMTKAQKEGNTQEVMLCFRQMGMIRKRAGISYRDQFLPIIMQGVIGYCGFKLMRACATLPVPGFHNGGFLWLQDLTMTDGYLLMPIFMAASVHLIVRMGGENGAQSMEMPAGMKKLMLWGMPGMIALVTAWQPGAVCVWFAGSGAVGLAQGQLLQRPAVRKFFGLAPLYKPKPGEGSAGFLSSLMESRMGDLKPQTSPLASGAMAGKNAAYMNPQYQSPNIQRQQRKIDTTLVTPQARAQGTAAAASDMIQPGASAAPKKNLSSRFKESWRATQERAEGLKNRMAPSVEKQKEAERKAFKRKAQEYEKAAQARGGKR